MAENQKNGKQAKKALSKSSVKKKKLPQKAAKKKAPPQRTDGKNTKKKSRKRFLLLFLSGIALVFIMAAAMAIGTKDSGAGAETHYTWPKGGVSVEEPDIDVQLLTVNKYSRVGKEIEKVNGIVVHYTANPGTTAKENRDYFESLKDTHERKASSNFVVGLEGEIVQCVPTWELAYASNERNADTVSIECCHPDESGKFTEATYWSVVKLCAFLCDKFGLSQKDIIRHYDVTGKLCPKYFVENEAAWKEFKGNVKKVLKSR